MNPRRTIILITAVVIGAVAAVGLLTFVRNVENAAEEEAVPVDIWVVTQEIPRGTSLETALEQGLIDRDQTIQRYLPATAVRDPATELAGLVAITDLPVDMPILTGSFVSADVVNTGITDRLEERDLVTVTFTVDQARGAAYLIKPGDYVNVMVEKPWDNPFWEEDPPIEITPEATEELQVNLDENDATRPILTDLYPVESRYVYQKAEVLAVGAELTPEIGQSTEVGTEAGQTQAQTNQGLITLAVPPEAVQVILNVGRENIYLSLVPENYVPKPLLPLDPTTQVYPGESQDRLTPYLGSEQDGSEQDPDSTDPDRLAFADDDPRIGNTPSGTGDDDKGDVPATAGDGGRGQDGGEDLENEGELPEEGEGL